MRLGIRSSVLLLALLPTTLAALLLGLYQMHTRLQDLEQAHRQRGQAIVNQLAPAAEFAVITQNDLILAHLAQAALQEADVVEVVIYNGLGETLMRGRRQADGALRIDPNLPWRPRTGWVFEAPIQRTALEVSESAFRFPATPAAAPTALLEIGSMLVEVARDPVTRRQQQILLTTLVLLLICLFGAAFAGWRLERTITGPIVTLGATVQQLREGDLSARVTERSAAELGALEAGINAMATALQAARDTLQQQVAEATQALRNTLALVEQQNMELQEARQQAEQASLAKSEFLATMSHELRTPLNGVLGFIALLAKTPLSEPQARQVELLQLSADNLLQVINSILDFSKMEAGKLVLHTAPFDVRDTLRYAVGLYTANAEAKGLALRLTLDPALPTGLVGDAQRFTQIVTNLVSNAVKFTEHGAVAIDAAPFQTSAEVVTVQLTVRDTGIGIDPIAQTLIFDAFRQVDGSRTRSQGGTGLGLAICQQLVTLMGGTIHLDSVPGLGSKFRVRLPFGRAPEPITPQSLAAQHPLVHLAGGSASPPATRFPVRVLVVDDHALNRTLARLVLEDWVTAIDEAADGRQALAACQAQRYDLILLDLRMPDLDGLEVARRLRATPGPNQGTPLVAVTADVLREGPPTWQAAGIDDCLHKPLVAEQLALIVRRWCVERRASPAGHPDSLMPESSGGTR